MKFLPLLRHGAQRLTLALGLAAGLAGAADPANIVLSPAGGFSTGSTGGEAAEIVAHDYKNQRLFVCNGSEHRVEVVDCKNPNDLKLVQLLDLTELGSPNSVSVYKGLVAIALQAPVKTDLGSVAFYDAKTLTRLAVVTVGAQPDMVTFTPNGKFVLVANEGEPNDDYTVDPEGSVSVIDLRQGIRKLTQAKVKQADFRAFNANEAELKEAGVRIFGPGATVAQDLEPEYIASTSNSRFAVITLQENNAVAYLDVMKATITKLVPLGQKDYSGDSELKTFGFPKRPVIGKTLGNQEILLGGFSGLWFEGVNPRNGNLRFITHPDRGPNAEPVDVNGDGSKERPFLLPDYQLELVRFEVDQKKNLCKITQRIKLKRQDGKTPITGRPNLPGPETFANGDEVPVDPRGTVLTRDPLGGDLEGIAVDRDGSFWLGDEYRPAIYHFDRRGKLLERYVPQGANAGGVTVGIEAFPAVYAQRRANRGFEAIAIDDGKLYAWIQSPIDNPDTANDASSKGSVNGRILEFDIASRTVTGEYLYRFEGGASDKIGDATTIANRQFLVVERDSATGPASLKKVFRVDLAKATNLRTLPEAIVGVGGTLELMDLATLAANGITPVRKELFVDLAVAGYHLSDKVEGLAYLGHGRIALLNDNDFGLTAEPLDLATGVVPMNPEAVPLLGLITSSQARLDPSDRDAGILIGHWSVFGTYMPDSVAMYNYKGRNYFITANEGDARDWDGFSEDGRVSGQMLDPTVFPDAADLRVNGKLGRLKLSTATSDTDGDGDVDQIQAYGARSFSIWDHQTGLQVFDSGDDFEQIIARTFPDGYNGDEGGFDSRSDDKGPEPEALTIGKLYGRTWAFIGMERQSCIMVYDITDPRSPRFVQVISTRNYAGDIEDGTAGDMAPEGMAFIEGRRSPTRKPLLVVAYENSGTVRVFNIARAPKP